MPRFDPKTQNTPLRTEVKGSKNRTGLSIKFYMLIYDPGSLNLPLEMYKGNLYDAERNGLSKDEGDLCFVCQGVWDRKISNDMKYQEPK